MISVADAILALAASIAIAGGLIGTGMAQQGIGAAGMGIIAEKCFLIFSIKLLVLFISIIYAGVPP